VALEDFEILALYNLASENALNYDVGEAQQLFDLGEGLISSAVIDGRTWSLFDGDVLGGTPGELIVRDDGEFTLILDNVAVSTFVSEPAGGCWLLCASFLWLRRRSSRTRRGTTHSAG